MKRPVNYNTKQLKAILEYIASLDGIHVTAAQIVEHFGKQKTPVGRTTVYRQLDRLAESGMVRRYTTDGVSGACYQYVDKDMSCKEHFHLKCESCGELLHLRCDTMDEIKSHILSRHSFEVNSMKTVFYGKCQNCQ